MGVGVVLILDLVISVPWRYNQFWTCFIFTLGCQTLIINILLFINPFVLVQRSLALAYLALLNIMHFINLSYFTQADTLIYLVFIIQFQLILTLHKINTLFIVTFHISFHFFHKQFQLSLTLSWCFMVLSYYWPHLIQHNVTFLSEHQVYQYIAGFHSLLVTWGFIALEGFSASKHS